MQLANTEAPSVSTLAGIDTVSSALHPENAEASMVLSVPLRGRLTFVRAVQELKAEVPIVSSELGRTMLDKSLFCAKELLPMVVSLLLSTLNTTDVKASQ